MRYAVCNETFEGWPHNRVCRFVAGLGYQGLEVAPFTLAPRVTDVPAARRRELRAQAEGCGLTIIGLHWLLAKTEGLQLTSADAGVRQATADYLGEELASRVKTGPVVYDLRIQFYTDEASTPIEVHDREWVGEWVTIGTLTIPQQDTASPRGRRVTELVEKMSFDPWHALVEHRPLGNMMRARNHAYRLSVMERKAAPEPDGSEKLEG